MEMYRKLQLETLAFSVMHHILFLFNIRHMGDLGNLEVSAEGSIDKSYIVDGVSIGGPKGILGRGLVVRSAFQI